MFKFKRILFQACIAAGLFVLLGAGLALADDTYTVTGGELVANQAVGVSSTFNTVITLTDVGGGDFGASETLLIELQDSRFIFNNTIEAGDITIGGSVVYIGNPNSVVYSSSDLSTVSLELTGAADPSINGETITISGLEVIAHHEKASGGAVALIEIDNVSSSIGTGVDTITTTDVDTTTTATVANAAVSLGTNSVVGASGTMGLGVTIPTSLIVGDKISFTVPSNIDASSILLTGHSFGTPGGTFACSAAGQVVTCTISGSYIGAAAGETNGMSLSGVLSTYVATGQTITDFAIKDSTQTSTIISDNSVAITDVTVGALTSTNVEPAQLIASLTSDNTISFTTNVIIPASGRIVVQYPTGWDVSGANGNTPTSCTGITCANWVASYSGQNLILTEDGTGATGTNGVSTPVAFTIAGIRNSSTPGLGSTYTIITQTSTPVAIQTDTAVAADTFYSGSGSSDGVFGIPTNFTVTDSPDGEGVLLTWDDPNGDSTSHIDVLRGVSPIPISATVYARVEEGEEQYIDTDVADGDIITYALRATDMETYGSMTAYLTITVGEGEEASTSEDSEEEETSGGTDDTSGTDSETADDEASADEEVTGETEVTELPFIDIEDHWAEAEIVVMAGMSVVQGHPDQTFRPDGNLNRAEAAALMYRFIDPLHPAAPDEDPFSDVDAGAWYAPYIAGLLELGLLNGNPDWTYQPDEAVNRAEFLTLAMNVYEHLIGLVPDASMTDAYVDLDTEAWYAQTVANATAMGFVEGSESEGEQYFHAQNPITRAESVIILHRMFAETL